MELNACASFTVELCQDWAGYLHNVDLIYNGVNFSYLSIWRDSKLVVWTLCSIY